MVIKAGRNYFAEDIEAAGGGVKGVRPGGVCVFSVADEERGTVTAYEYDTMNRLIAMNQDATGLDLVTQYTYDRLTLPQKINYRWEQAAQRYRLVRKVKT